MPSRLSAACLRRAALTLLALLAASPTLAQPDVTLVKRTNGQDANTPPGPVLLVGAAVTWTYEVTASGSRDLSNVVVTDDQSVMVSCPSTTVLVGTTMTCTGNGTAVAGQYANVGTVDAGFPDGTPVSASDPSHYFGQAAPSVAIEKATEGFDADTPPGPSLAAGDPVSWTYEVTNIGTEPLTNVDVTDDQGVAVSCPGTSLAPGESMTCTASGTVQVGPYANVGTVTADLPDESQTVASDPSHYFGQVLLLEKATNGQDADLPPGPQLDAGDAVAWTYEVTNPGPATVTGLAVTDDQGVVVSCPVTTLAAGESTICTGNGIAQAGPYVNVGTATAQLPAGGTVTASDPSHYLGRLLRIQKATNGQDADLPTGPVVAVGSPISWTYEVTNFAADPVTNVVVTDDQGVTVNCPSTTLAAGASMTCTANGLAVAGQYGNIGTVTADDITMQQIADSDPSHYFGQDQVLDFGDAADPPYFTSLATNGARHLLGSAVFLGACVDSELDGQPSAGADGDDLGAGIATFGTCAVPGADEDGVVFTSQVVAGTTAGVDVTANEACTLSAWLDFAGDGDWTDPGDDLFPGGTALVAGVNSLAFAVPVGAASGIHAARFRCTTAGAVSFLGDAPDGEVEDALVEVFSSPAALAATKVGVLFADADGDGMIDPGDTVAYTVVITNSGDAPALAVVFTDTPDANTGLVVGSVTTTAGSVVLGNGGGDTTIQVDAGDIAGGGSVTITYQATVDDPLPIGPTTITNQGLVTATNHGDVPTDDPTVAGSADPTVLPLAPRFPEVTASKTGAVTGDVDGDGILDPGDTITYTVVLANGGAAPALAVTFTDTPDANTALVVGSVTTTAGTVILGNTAGDTSIEVAVGDMAVHGPAVTITYDATLADPLAVNVTTVTNQGLATGTNFADVATDDPGVAGGADPTVIAVAGAPTVEIPTLGGVGLAFLAALLAVAGLWLRRSRGALATS